MPILSITTTKGATELGYATLDEANREYDNSIAEFKRDHRTDLVMMYIRKGSEVMRMRQFSTTAFLIKKNARADGYIYKPKKKHPRGSGIEYNSRHLMGLDIHTGKPHTYKDAAESQFSDDD